MHSTRKSVRESVLVKDFPSKSLQRLMWDGGWDEVKSCSVAACELLMGWEGIVMLSPSMMFNRVGGYADDAPAWT